MTQAEFKAWFEGFTEALEGAPNKAQWKRIKERVAEIDGKVVTERVFIDRYWPQYIYHPWVYNSHRYWPPTYTTCNQSLVGANTSTAFYNGAQTPGMTLGENFSSANAMYALGKADAGQDL